MDSDLWAARLAAINRQYTLQQRNHSSHLDTLGIDGFEVEGEVLPDFPCPYCYEDFDIASLCAHLQDEHSDEPNITVCPVCFAKVSHYMLSHIIHQHGKLLKVQRGHKLRRVTIPDSQALLLLGHELREAQLQNLLGGGGRLSSNNDRAPSTAATDPFFSSLTMNFHASKVEEVPRSVTSSIEELSATETASSRPWKEKYL